MVARARQPRTVHCAEYPQTSKLGLSGHALFSLEAQIVASDALGEFHYKVAGRCGVLTLLDYFQVVILAVLCGVVTSKKSPSS